MTYRSLFLPIALPFSGKTTIATIFQGYYEPKLEILGLDIVREQLHPGYLKGEINFNTINANDIFIEGINQLEHSIENADVWWDSVNLSRQMRAIVAFSAQKICHLTDQDIKITAIDFKIPFRTILERYEQSENRPTPSLEKLENMLKIKLTEPVDLETENIDELTIIEWKENKWELVQWDVSSKCQFIAPEGTKIADLVRKVNEKYVDFDVQKE